MPELIITEKPSTAEKIASALDKKPQKKKEGKVSYYEVEHNGKKIMIACAVGHLFGLAEKEKQGWHYPVFDVEWKPAYEVSKAAKHTKQYISVIKKLAKNADSFTIGTDFDIEGEVIGYNILRFICKKEDAKRMKFSTTTKDDLLNAYENAWKHIDFLQAEAGITRHMLDYYYGINLSRALTLAIKHATGMFKILSSGRVQGPALKILAEREKEIQNFQPKPYWRIELVADNFSAFHIDDKFWEKSKAEEAIKKAKEGKCVISKVEKKQFEHLPPHPFDLTALQIEAYRQHGIQPKETLDIAQKLYVNSYISYPRTSANQLPPSIGYEKIISKLAKNPAYTELCEKLLKMRLVPNNGNKTDRAHPAIYFTGETPKNLSEKEAKVYDLIVRRTLSTFAEPALRETMMIEISANGEIFETRGTKTIKKGWHEFYGQYARFEEAELPELKEGEVIKAKEFKLHELQTQPPKRFTPASIIKALEAKNLGTKATRSEIIDHLFKREYVKGQSIEVTNLGFATVKTLEKYCPEILDEKLTAKFEKEMEEIMEKKKRGEEVINEAKEVLTGILEKFKKRETEIGKELAEATKETRDKESIIGKCKKCGGELRILYSKQYKTKFVACSNYPECKTTFSLPSGLPKPTDKMCPLCNYPMVTIIRAGKRPFDYCINKECPAKVKWREEQKKNKEPL